MAARAKRVDPLKAKAAKQKKIAIGGMAVLCLMLFIQGPKTLKMLRGPQPVESAQPAPATPAAAPGTTTPGTTTPGTPAPAGAATDAEGDAVAAGTADLATFADSDPAPAVESGQLVSFERFESKDPFAPQATATPAPAASAGSSGGAPAADDGGAADAGGSGTAAPADDNDVDGGFTPAPAGEAPSTAVLAAATSISVNGAAENVATDASFPTAQPTFVLVSLARNGKSAQIGVAGGSYANGEATITLKVGTPLVLQNTADGSRYEIELLAVQGFPVPKQ